MIRHFSYLYKHSYFKIILCVLVAVFCASCNLKTRIKRADRKFEIGEYYDAADLYRSCYKKTKSKDKKTRAYLAFRQGECYRYINNQKASAAYRNAIRNHYPDSIVYLHQAQVLHYQGLFKDALKYYDIYLQAHPNDYVALGGKFACENMQQWKGMKTRYKFSLAKEFNYRRGSSFSPSFIGDDYDALMFTSNRQTTKQKRKKPGSPITGESINALYSTRKNKDGKWEDVEPTEELISTENNDAEGGDANSDTSSAKSPSKANKGSNEEGAAGNSEEGISLDAGGMKTTPEIGVCTFTADGKTMYFTYSKPINGQDQGTKIFRSDRASGTWGEPQEIRLFLDSTISCGHPSLSHSGDTLYFVSDAPGGFGGKDIWFAWQDGEQWSIPENMGEKINTEGDEMFPYIRQDGRLYFASNGHSGFGGLDIFFAVKTDTIQIYNMGLPFNSNGDDFGIAFEGTAERGFFSSNRNQRKGWDQIYRFELPEMVFYVEGKVTDMNGDNLTDARLRLVGTDGTNAKVQVHRDGTYRLKLNRNVKYVMLGTARGYLNQKQELNTENLDDSKTFTKDFSLAAISKPVTMNNIFYDFAKWTLTPQSEQGLQALVKLLNDNPNITIELSAHTDYVGNDQSNKTLSEKRAQSVVTYLIEHGIQKDRLTAVGYGEEKPVVVTQAMNKKYKFLPVDQVLTEEFILTLTKDQQEVCNQINRRTEFRVLRTTYNLY